MKKRRKKKKQNISLVLSSLLLLVLVCLVIYLTTVVVVDYTTNISINKREKATIVYTDKSDEVITISNEVLLSDKLSMQSNNKYEFEINNSNDNNNYIINIVKVNSQIEDKYIKLYLTDKNDKEISNFTKPVKLSDLEQENNNKVLYKGVLNNSKENFILRIWVSDKYKSNEIKKFSFKINIEN